MHWELIGVNFAVVFTTDIEKSKRLGSEDRGDRDWRAILLEVSAVGAGCVCWLVLAANFKEEQGMSHPSMRFWKFVEKTSSCWIWKGATAQGYGVMGNGTHRGLVKAHRVSFEMHIGPIPKGLEIDHICRHRFCVNPAHLRAVTHVENMQNGSKSLQTMCVNGHKLDKKNTAFLHAPGRASFRRCRKCHVINNDKSRKKMRELRKKAGKP